MSTKEPIYVRYYVCYGGDEASAPEFLEFEFCPDGRFRYSSESRNKAFPYLRKEVFVSGTVLRELRRIIEKSRLVSVSDEQWPAPSQTFGVQELEVANGVDHVLFRTAKIGAMLEVQESKDPEGLRQFYFLIQDLKCLVFSLMKLHFKIDPI